MQQLYSLYIFTLCVLFPLLSLCGCLTHPLHFLDKELLDVVRVSLAIDRGACLNARTKYTHAVGDKLLYGGVTGRRGDQVHY